VTGFSDGVHLIRDIIWQIMGFAETPTIKENDKHDSDED